MIHLYNTPFRLKRKRKKRKVKLTLNGRATRLMSIVARSHLGDWLPIRLQMTVFCPPSSIVTWMRGSAPHKVQIPLDTSSPECGGLLHTKCKYHLTLKPNYAQGGQALKQSLITLLYTITDRISIPCTRSNCIASHKMKHKLKYLKFLSFCGIWYQA